MKTTQRIFIFECNSNTYGDCIQKSLFGSNLPWPLQVKAGDLCFLYHYEVNTMFGIWLADCEGARNLIPKAWGGKFPFQVRVKLISHEIEEVPEAIVMSLSTNNSNGRLNNLLNMELADELLKWASGKAKLE